MHQVVIDVVRAQVLEGIAVHLLGGIHESLAGDTRPIDVMVRHLGGDEIAVARVTAQGKSGSWLRFTFLVNRRRIEIIQSGFEGMIHEAVYRFLVDNHLFVTRLTESRPAHATVAK